jgi:hypothetical protein
LDRYDRRWTCFACLFFEYGEMGSGKWEILFYIECDWRCIELLCSRADRFHAFCYTRSDLDCSFNMGPIQKLASQCCMILSGTFFMIIRQFDHRSFKFITCVAIYYFIQHFIDLLNQPKCH